MQIDLEKLRRAAALPSIPITADFSFSPRLVHLGDTRDLPPQIARLEQELKGTPGDYTRWQRLGLLQAEIGATTASQDAYRKAAALLEKALSGRADDSRIQARLGECYQAQGRLAEAEAVLRSAVRINPKEWRAWIALGELLDAKAWKRLAPTQADLDALKSSKTLAELKARLSSGFSQKLTGPALAEAKRLTDEAHTCYDRAVTAGSQDPEPYLARAASRMLSEGGVGGLVTALERSSAGAETMKRLLSPEVAADLRRARRLAADSPETTTATAAMECFWIILEKGDPLEELGTEASWKAIPQAAQAPIIEAMLRLSELATSPDRSISAAASEGLGILAFIRGQQEKMENHLKKAASLRPLNTRSLDLLTLAYLSSGRIDEVARLYQEQIQRDDTPRRRYVLAKALYKLNKKDSARLQLGTALQSAPDDFYCNLGMAALLLQDNQPDAATATLMRLAELERKGKLPDDQRAELFAILGIWQGLRGKTDEAKATLKKAQSLDTSNESATEALAALG
jgi:tetratricopeptide (TPR) repeat protein